MFLVQLATLMSTQSFQLRTWIIFDYHSATHVCGRSNSPVSRRAHHHHLLSALPELPDLSVWSYLLHWWDQRKRIYFKQLAMT